jgi:hypothetical protein
MKIKTFFSGCSKYPLQMSPPPRSFGSHRVAPTSPLQDNPGLREAEADQAQLADSEEQRRPDAVAPSPKADFISLA